MDKMRWRFGETNPVMAEVLSDTIIEIGDLIWYDGTAKPFELLKVVAAHLEEEFQQRFLGVAMGRSRKGENAPLRVATSGTFEFECSSGDYDLGDRLAVAGNQRVVKTDLPHFTIAKVERKRPGPPVLARIITSVTG